MRTKCMWELALDDGVGGVHGDTTTQFVYMYLHVQTRFLAVLRRGCGIYREPGRWDGWVYRELT